MDLCSALRRGLFPLVGMALASACEAPPDANGPGGVEVNKQALVNCVPGDNEVAMFRDANYAGSCSYYGVDGLGRGFNANLAVNGWPEAVGNDVVSSIRVGRNAAVVLFNDGNYQVPPPSSLFGGRGRAPDYWSFRADSSFVGPMNDQASSAYVFTKDRDCFANGYSPRQGEVAVWTDANFFGRCMVLRASDTWDDPQPGRFHTLPGIIPNDSISSLMVGPNTTLRTYRNVNFFDVQETFASGSVVSNLGSSIVGNDQISSLIVE
jgi:hypothetical protein